MKSSPFLKLKSLSVNMMLNSSISAIDIKGHNMPLPANIIVFSHLRWDFVYQRPQHLLTRFAADFKITLIEEPIFDSHSGAYYAVSKRDGNITIMVPHLPQGLNQEHIIQFQKDLLDQYMVNKAMSDYAFWYYTPMALEFSRKHTPELVIFDCMDELSAFKFAPASLKALEQELLNKADVVFTGGHSIYQAKKHQHANIHPFPSSIEAEHFAKARQTKKTANRQVNPEKPVLGFYGVIDERFDIELIRGIAEAKPDWQIKLIGPVVKIDAATLPKNSNIQYLGSKSYQELPSHLATWDIALIPFLLNDSTKFISPTKTPEYLAAGLPVVSTPIRDVINPYGVNKLVYIGGNAEDFVTAIESELKLSKPVKQAWLKKVDLFLSQNSWDITYKNMFKLAKQVIINKSQTRIAQ
jgi:glycosyltransferase involved in cell wall biosynthesis